MVVGGKVQEMAKLVGFQIHMSKTFLQVGL